MSTKADYKEIIQENKDQVRILKDEVAELQDNCKAKDSALKRTTQKYENTLEDLDKSNGLLFVTYNGDQGSWWDGLFTSDSELLEKGDYRLKVAKAGANRTSVTFMDNESVPFEANQVSDLYSAFAEVMSEDNLDI